MADDRDKRRPITPPLGVRQQLARPVTERGGGMSRADSEMTPVRAIASVRGEVMERIDEVHKELKEDVADVRNDVAAVSQQVDQIIPKLIDAVVADKAASRELVAKQTDVWTHQKTVETEEMAKTGAVKREELAKSGAAKREWIGKLVIAVVGLLGAVAAFLSGTQCGT